MKALAELHARLEKCRRCPRMHRPVIHGPALRSRVMLVGQAPGPHEAKVMKPFGWKAGKTLFAWFEEGLGWNEQQVRERIYIAAVARCFPGKSKSGSGDRRPDAEEMDNCRPWLAAEVALLKPRWVLPVGALAISEVLGQSGPLVDFVGKTFTRRYHGVQTEVIPLPHPSGLSSWPRLEPGRSLLKQAMALIRSRLN